MSRSLRARNSRPNYASMIAFEDEDGAGPSSIPLEEDPDSGSEFAVEEDLAGPGSPELVDPDTDEEEIDDDLEVDSESDGVRKIRPIPNRSKSKAAPQSQKAVEKKVSVNFGPSLPRGYSSNKMYALPTPSIHHRHRAVPIFFRSGRAERLEARPKLFDSPRITSTNCFTDNPLVQDRVNKAWGFNVGSGPLWDLLEDRSWYKEALDGDGVEEEKEANRRPQVYVDVPMTPGWEILSSEDGSAYLPSDNVLADDGNLRPAPPVACSLGPFGEQTRVELKMLESRKMSEFFSENKAHIFNAGAPVWGLDWCPIHADDRSSRSYKQYLAVAPFPSSSHSPEIGVKAPRPSKACVQIWSLSPSQNDDGMDVEDEEYDDNGEMKCEMVLCLDGGPAYELKWCPLPSHDLSSHSDKPNKLGILAGTFEDGSVSIYTVPDPMNVSPSRDPASGPIYVKMSEPLLKLELDETSCWAVDWANSEVIAVGCTNGNIAVYDVGKAIKGGQKSNVFPTHYISVHQSAIRALAWIRAPPSSEFGPLPKENPTVLASGGYDGAEYLLDIRDPPAYIMNRTRDVINSVAYAPYGGGPVTIDHENTVKTYSVSPSMLGRGHELLGPTGPVWSVDASEYHPQLAVGSTDGTCVTTNALRSTRRGGTVPFFVHKIYQLDLNRNSGEMRMLEKFFPQEIIDKPTLHKRKGKGPEASNKEAGTGVWPPSIGVHRVTWNCGNGLAAASLLASATGTGLCRVDRLDGRWLKGKVPYHGIEAIRREGGAEADEEADDSDEGEDEIE